jgi:rhamnulokinase
VTGIQNLPFNTVYQLVADRFGGAYTLAERMLLLPDLLAYWLTGQVGAEVTNASTTALLDATTRQWSAELISQVGLRPELFAPLREPGTVVGGLRPDVVAEIGGTAPVIAVGSHDTASAVVGVPAADDRFGYISCGTWSLVGVELDAPVLTEDSRRANFTNEVGVDDTIRYLRNVMGLWLLQECLRAWPPVDLAELLTGPEERQRSVRSSIRTTRSFPRPVTCPAGSPTPAAGSARSRPIRRPPSYDPLWRVWRWRTGGRCAMPRSSAAGRWTWCISWVVACATPCCAS